MFENLKFYVGFIYTTDTFKFFSNNIDVKIYISDEQKFIRKFYPGLEDF